MDAGELLRFQAGVTMEISRLDAWYSGIDGSLEGPATYIVRGLCRRCCIPEVILRCMQVSLFPGSSKSFAFLQIIWFYHVSFFPSVLPCIIHMDGDTWSLVDSIEPCGTWKIFRTHVILNLWGDFKKLSSLKISYIKRWWGVFFPQKKRSLFRDTIICG